MTTEIVNTTLGILHNCAKMKVNCALLRGYGFIEVAEPYTDISHNIEEIALRAVVTISYMMEENETSIARISHGMVRFILCMFSGKPNAIANATLPHDCQLANN